jgi:hypothetical protein
MKALALLTLVLLATPALAARDKTAQSYNIPLPPKPDFSSLAFLVGDWTGQTPGKGLQTQIHLTVSPALDNHFMIFHEEISFNAAATAPDSQESWMGILNTRAPSSDYDLRVYSSTGFMTRYRVSVEGTQVSFSPEGGENPPPGWLFRRTLEKIDDSDIQETVEAAPPGKPFFKYYTAKLVRSIPKGDSSAPASAAKSPQH